MYVPTPSELLSGGDRNNCGYTLIDINQNGWGTHVYREVRTYHRKDDNTYWHLATLHSLQTGEQIGFDNPSAPVEQVII